MTEEEDSSGWNRDIKILIYIYAFVCPWDGREVKREGGRRKEEEREEGRMRGREGREEARKEEDDDGEK